MSILEVKPSFEANSPLYDSCLERVRKIGAPIFSVVIPVYHESLNLKITLAAIREVFESLTDSYEIILIDDGSTDDTWGVIEEEAEKYPSLRAARLTRNFGKESALCAGLEMAKGSAVIIMDGDLQHPPQLIPKMAQLWWESQADVVEAIKEDRGREPLTSKIGAKVFYAALNGLSGNNLKNATDYKLIDRRVVDAWLQMREHSLFFRGMIDWLGFKSVRIPFTVQERVGGQSKWSIFRQIRLAINGVTSFTSLPLHFITFAGGAFLLFAIGLGVHSLLLKFEGKALGGFTTVNLLLLIIGSLLMISLGIIGEYLARIYDEVKNRPRYIVAKTIK